MADGSKIEWTEATWNPITGCTVAGPGCRFCYAMTLAGTRMKHHPSREGLTKPGADGPLWTGEVRLNDGEGGRPEWITQPLAWKRPREIFVNAHGDTFHDAVPDEWIDRLFAVMALSPQHRFQVLTKRAARMRRYVTGFGDRPEAFGRALAWVARKAGLNREAGTDAIDAMRWPLPNVWLGVSTENQAAWDERVPDLLATPAAVRWISAEPLLGLIEPGDMAGLHWVVVGGESDRLGRSRAMHPEWARQLRDACIAQEVAFFFKQWGDYAEGAGGASMAIDTRGARHPLDTYQRDVVVMGRCGKAAAGRQLDGRTWDEMPEVIDA